MVGWIFGNVSNGPGNGTSTVLEEILNINPWNCHGLTAVVTLDLKVRMLSIIGRGWNWVSTNLKVRRRRTSPLGIRSKLGFSLKARHNYILPLNWDFYAYKYCRLFQGTLFQSTLFPSHTFSKPHFFQNTLFPRHIFFADLPLPRHTFSKPHLFQGTLFPRHTFSKHTLFYRPTSSKAHSSPASRRTWQHKFCNLLNFSNVLVTQWSV